MNVIFLDIDGVLVTERGMEYLSNDGEDTSKIHDENGHPHFCPLSVSKLKMLIEMTQAKIVVSSTWRHSGLDFLKQLWKERNMPGEIIDITPSSKDRVRGYEIDKWLKSKGYYYPKSNWDAPMWEELRQKCEIKNYCIIDDDTDMLINQYEHFVKTDPYNGLAGHGVLSKCLIALSN